MHDIFISHAEEDDCITLEIAETLEKEGYSTWYYERDGILGKDHFMETGEAIERCKAFILLISPHSIVSFQVEEEAKQARESRKFIIPILHNISYSDFIAQQPHWRYIIGTKIAISIPSEGVSGIIPRILKALLSSNVIPGENQVVDRNLPLNLSEIIVNQTKLSKCEQALILKDRGDLEEALAILEEEEQTCHRTGNEHNLSIILGKKAAIYKDLEKYKESMELLKKQENICRRLNDSTFLRDCFFNQALVQMAVGELDEAMKLLKEQEQAGREVGDKAGLGRSLSNQALILQERGEFDEAAKLRKEEERIYRELDDKGGLSRSLGNQANIHYSRGEFDEAMKLRKEEESICRELGDKAGLSICLSNQANILASRGDFDEAIKLHKEEKRICGELGDPQGLACLLFNQAVMLANKGQPKEAVPLAEEAYQLATKYGYTSLAKHFKYSLDIIRLQLRGMEGVQ